MTEFFGKRKSPYKGHVSLYETNMARDSGMAGGPIEGPAKVRSERTTALIPAFSIWRRRGWTFSRFLKDWMIWKLPPHRVGRGRILHGSFVSFFKARSGPGRTGVKRLDELSVDGNPVKINSLANQHNGAVAKETSSREHHGERKSSDVSRRSSFKGN
jgi:hypothetical protein